MSLKFNQFLSLKERALENKGINESINSEETLKIINEYLDSVGGLDNALRLNEEDIMAKVKALLKQSANFAKANAGLEGQYAKKTKARIQKDQVDAEFDDTWADKMAAEKDQIKDKFDQQMEGKPKAVKTKMRTKRDLELKGLEDNSSELKAAEKKKVLSSAENTISSADKKIGELKGLDMADWQKSVISAMDQEINLDSEIRYANALKGLKKEKGEKALKRAQEEQQKAAKKIAEKLEKAEAKEQSMQNDLNNEVSNVSGDGIQDEKQKKKFDDGKEKIKAANTEFGKYKTAAKAYANALKELANIEDNDENQDAIDSAEGKVTEVEASYESAQQDAKNALKDCLTWCGNNENSEVPEIKSLAATKDNFEKFMEAFDDMEMTIKDIKGES